MCVMLTLKSSDGTTQYNVEIIIINAIPKVTIIRSSPLIISAAVSYSESSRERGWLERASVIIGENQYQIIIDFPKNTLENGKSWLIECYHVSNYFLVH